jgi:hypothetical protein
MLHFPHLRYHLLPCSGSPFRPLSKQVLIDWSITEEFLEAIGRSTGPIVFAVYPSDPSKPCIHIKADAEDMPRSKIEGILSRNPQHSLGFIVNPPTTQPASWGTKPEHINKAGEIKAWGASNAHIDHAIAVFAECDGNLDRDAQAALPALAGLPEPTVSVWTGGKSLHHYWIFTPGQEPDPRTFSDLQRRIATAIEIVAPDSKPDKSISNASRVMRLPGGIHPGTGNRTVIAHVNQETFTPDEISAAAPAFFELGTKPPEPSHHWFSDLPIERQRSLAIEMLRDHIPLRTEAGQGRYPECFAVLAGVTHHFGAKAAQEIVQEADWQSPGTWEPAKKILTIGDAPIRASIKRLINTAIANGWQVPEDVNTDKEEHELPSEDYHSAIPFDFLGYTRDSHYFKSRDRSLVTAMKPAGFTKTGLINLASSLSFWESKFTVENKTDWDLAIEWLIQESNKKGYYNPERVRGRGAWVDAHRVIFHLGMRMMVDNREQPVSRGLQSYYIYEHATPLLGPSDSPMDDERSSQILELAKSFSWDTYPKPNMEPSNPHLLAGWLTLAPVCGALQWRPHIWITGGKGTGKTSILTRYIKPLLGEIYKSATGGTTEPGLRAALKSDAIPVLFDEFEQNDLKDKQNMQNVLAMARVASSEGGKIIKGSAGGGEANQYEIRSMFCVSSINVGLIQGADADRFCLLALRRGQNDWTKLESQLSELCTEENGRDLVSRTLNRLPSIRGNAKTFASVLAKKKGQRWGDQHGTLLAGAFSLREDSDRLLSQEEAEKICSSIDWSLQDKESRDDDEEACLAAILESLIQLEGGKRLTIMELVEMFFNFDSLSPLQKDIDPSQVLGRYGIRISQGSIAIANSNTNLQQLLSNTAWSGGAHKHLLKRIKGAEPSSTTLHFPGSKKSRAILIPLTALDEAS